MSTGTEKNDSSGDNDASAAAAPSFATTETRGRRRRSNNSSNSTSERFIAIPYNTARDESSQDQSKQLESLREPMDKVKNTMQRAESQSKLLLMMNKDMKDMFLVFTKLWILYQRKKNDESILINRLMAIIEESNILTNEEMQALAQEQNAIMTEVQNIHHTIDEEFFTESNPLFQSLAPEEKLFLKNRSEERDSLLRQKLASIGLRPQSALRDFKETIPARFLEFMQAYYQSQYTADQAQIIVSKLNPTISTEFIKLDELFKLPEFPIYLPQRMDIPLINVLVDMFYAEVSINDFSSLQDLFLDNNRALRRITEEVKLDTVTDDYRYGRSSVVTKTMNADTVHLLRFVNTTNENGSSSSSGRGLASAKRNEEFYYVFCHKEFSDKEVIFFLPRDQFHQNSTYVRIITNNEEINKDRFAFEYHTRAMQTEEGTFSCEFDKGILFQAAPRERSKEWIDLYIRPIPPRTRVNALSLVPSSRSLDFIIACLFFYGKHVELQKGRREAATAYVSIPQRDIYKNGIFDPSVDNQVFTEVLEPNVWLQLLVERQQSNKVVETFIHNFLRSVNKESFINACQSESLQRLIVLPIDLQSMQSFLLPVWYYSNGIHKSRYPYFCYPTFVLGAHEITGEFQKYFSILNIADTEIMRWNVFYNTFFGGRMNKFIWEYYSAETKGRFNQFVRLKGPEKPEEIMTEEMKQLKIYIDSCEDSPWMYKIFRITLALIFALLLVKETESVSFRDSYENICMLIAELRNYSRSLFEKYFQILFQPKTSVQDLALSIKTAFEYSILKMRGLGDVNAVKTLLRRYQEYLFRGYDENDKVLVEKILFEELDKNTE